jgi:hypothetical protein
MHGTVTSQGSSHGGKKVLIKGQGRDRQYHRGHGGCGDSIGRGAQDLGWSARRRHITRRTRGNLRVGHRFTIIIVRESA